jgi:ribose transport system substrate-binding protein
MEQLLARPKLPSAVFVADNPMALGALRRIRSAGLRIPHDISLASFDDPAWFALADPPMTAVAQPTAEMGRTAVRMLRAMLRGETVQSVTLGCQLPPAGFLRRRSTPDRRTRQGGVMHAHAIRAAAAATLAVLGATMAVGCGNSGGGAQTGKAKVAVATRNFNNPYWAALRDGANAQGKAMGLNVNVQAGSSETDANGENQKISTLATQDYTCYAVVPVNATNIITPLVPVSRKGKPIINLDTQIDQNAAKKAKLKITSFIGSDNVQAGTIAGKGLLKATGGSGDVLILKGIPGEQNGINRIKGFNTATGGKLKVVGSQVANYEQSQGLTAAETLLKAHPEVKGIFAANDTMALGAAQAVRNAGKTGKVHVIGVDGIKQALDAVKSGKLDGTVTQYPYVEGQLAVEACQALAKGKKIPKRIVSPVKLIDKSIVDQQIKAFPKSIGGFKDPVKQSAK